MAAPAAEIPPPAETVAAVLSDYLTNLREALLDQEPYHDLVQHDMRRALNDILAELRPLDYDDEAIYRAQMAELYRELGFIGIPELKERRPITLQDIFIRLRSKSPGRARGAGGLAVEESLTNTMMVNAVGADRRAGPQWESPSIGDDSLRFMVINVGGYADPPLHVAIHGNQRGRIRRSAPTRWRYHCRHCAR